MSKNHKKSELRYPMQTIEQVLTMRTDEMIDACTDLLLDYYPGTGDDCQVWILGDNFVYAVGDSPITLVAHVDTVRDHFVPKDKNGNPEITKSWRKDDDKPMALVRNRNVMSNANGILGADDRAGVFGCLELVRRCHAAKLPMPSVILTNGEESGGIGVGVFTETDAFKKHDKGTRLFVELDRCNSVDWVSYGGTLPVAVVDYVESFGFKKSHGSYSDIADLQEEYLIPAVNLSIGYYSQHTQNEVLHLDEMYMTINRVFGMLKDPIDKLYPVEKKPAYSYKGYGGHFGDYDDWSDYYDHRYGKDTKTTNTNGGKGNEKSGNGNTSESKTSFPQNRPGKVGIDDILDSLTKGGFCMSCGFIWNECNCGEMLSDIVRYMDDEEITMLIANYLQEDDEMFDLLTTYMEMRSQGHLEEGGKVIEGEIVKEEDQKLLPETTNGNSTNNEGGA